jgi:hypothetical protein
MIKMRSKMSKKISSIEAILFDINSKINVLDEQFLYYENINETAQIEILLKEFHE